MTSAVWNRRKPRPGGSSPGRAVRACWSLLLSGLACGGPATPGPAVGPAAEPDPAAGTCRGQADCVPPARCVVPPDDINASVMCGSPGVAVTGGRPACESDTDCPPQRRCYRALPSGVVSPPVCCAPPGCATDDVCGEGRRCDADGHCAPIECATDADCPSFFSCAAGRCSRLECADDAECGTGYCMFRTCREGLGRCETPPSPVP